MKKLSLMSNVRRSDRRSLPQVQVQHGCDQSARLGGNRGIRSLVHQREAEKRATGRMLVPPPNRGKNDPSDGASRESPRLAAPAHLLSLTMKDLHRRQTRRGLPPHQRILRNRILRTGRRAAARHSLPGRRPVCPPPRGAPPEPAHLAYPLLRPDYESVRSLAIDG